MDNETETTNLSPYNPTNAQWYGLLEVSWIRDCRSNARNVFLSSCVLVIFVLGNLFYLLHLVDKDTVSGLYTFASTDAIIVPIVIASLVAIYQVLLGEIFFIHFTKKIQGTDMWVLWILLLILVSASPHIYESMSGFDSSTSTTSDPSTEAPTSSAPDPSTEAPKVQSFYQSLASSLGQIGFLAAMAFAVTAMYILWIYHALFVQLSVNDGFSLPQFVKNIRVNILESAGRPRVLIQSVIIGPKESGKSELRRQMADPLHIFETAKVRTQAAGPSDPNTNHPRAQMADPLPGTTSPPSRHMTRVPPRTLRPTQGQTTTRRRPTPSTAGPESRSATVGALTAGTQQVEFGYRDIKVNSPFASGSRPRSIQLCHYMLDCAGELLGDHIFLPFSVRADVLIVLIRATALNAESPHFKDPQYWTLRAIEELWARWRLWNVLENLLSGTLLCYSFGSPRAFVSCTTPTKKRCRCFKCRH